MRHATRFVGLWTLAVVATASAFILYLALRSRAVELCYKLGRARGKQAQLRETRRVLQVEAVAYRNPERVGALAQGVLQLEEPPPQRIFVVGAPIEATELAKPAPTVAVKPSAAIAPPAAPPVPSIDLVPAVDLEGPGIFGKPVSP